MVDGVFSNVDQEKGQHTSTRKKVLDCATRRDDEKEHRLDGEDAYKGKKRLFAR